MSYKNVQYENGKFRTADSGGATWGGIDGTLSDQTDLATALAGKADKVTRKYIVICDSYGNYTNSNSRNFYSEAFHRLGITDFYDFHRGSSGFGGNGDYAFLKVLKDNESVITDKTQITDVIVAGGANDQGTLATLDSGMQAFISYVKTNYPNAKISIGDFTKSVDPQYISTVQDTIKGYKQCSNYGANYISNSEYVMMKLSFFISDNCHPSADGIEALTKYFCEYLLDGYFDVDEYAENTIGIENTSLFSGLSYDHLLQHQHNGEIMLHCSGGGTLAALVTNGSHSVSVGQTAFATSIKFTDGFLYSFMADYYVNIPVIVLSNNEATYAGEGAFLLSRPALNKTVSCYFVIFSDSNKTLQNRTAIGCFSKVIPMW